MPTSRQATAMILAMAWTLATEPPANAAALTACEALPAATATLVVGRTVKATDAPWSAATLSAGKSSVCIYSAGAPIFELGILMAASREGASQLMAATSRGPSERTLSRQKRNLIVSAITLNHDPSKLAALVDAAIKNL